MKGSVSVVITGISINFMIKKYLDNFKVSSKCRNMQTVSIEFRHSIYIHTMSAQKGDNVIIAFIAGIV